MAPSGSQPRSSPWFRVEALDRMAFFRVLLAALIAFLALYVASIQIAEALLDGYFREIVRLATRVSPTDGPIVSQIQNGVSDSVQGSFWTRVAGVRVNVTVLGADGQTPLYVGGGKVVPPPPAANLDAAMRETLRLLPTISDVFVSVPPGSALSVGFMAFYGAFLLHVLFLYNRAVARREEERIATAIAARNTSADRARAIEEELAKVRSRLQEVEPGERAHAAEIEELETEREGLRRKLRELAEREAELRASAARSSELEEERQALEELLEEALEDVGQKESEIANLQDRLKHAAKKPATGGSKAREAERLARRMRTLYKNLEIDDRAISDLVALRDETMKLRAEEGLKRLTDDPESAGIRRKVGGLPPHLSIFEMGFAGKGRIYYTRGEGGGYRVLAIGAKNTQKIDLEYLSRLPVGD
ncbi:MAG: hypothetical protein OEM49_02300 [Myxococcales bacterium]|nr:hypothetical protein [Myxococcales bacterium]MDH5308078.1 hypothetical protein [Myxococcales bacterium]MDH5566972.1 hypothetical protein [Myxococcales bacterium]